jgi:hypothetical protein
MLLVDQGKWSEAEAMLLPALHTAQTQLAPGHPVRGKLLDAAIHLYDSWHAAEPGEGHGGKRAEWRAKLRQTQP